MRIMVTGHRPNKLWGYDLEHPNYEKLYRKFKEILLANNCTEAITGMALGVDTVFAMAVLDLKDSGYDIKLHCAIPCRNHSSKWPKESQLLYNSILKDADKITLVCDREYTPDVMQRRNEFMVDNSDLAIGVWDGSKGGTANCLAYVCLRGRERILININDIERMKLE